MPVVSSTTRETIPPGKTARVLARLFGLPNWPFGKEPVATKSSRSGTPVVQDYLSSLINEFGTYSQIGQDRVVRYSDYDAMDETSPEIAMALSLYATEATAEDPRTGKVMWPITKDPKLEKWLSNKIRELMYEEQSWGMCRNMAKFGDIFVAHMFRAQSEGKARVANDTPPSKETYQLKKLQYFHPARAERVEADVLLGFRAPDLAIILDPDETGMYRPWDITHGRIMAYDKELLYGRSMIEEIRKIWKMVSIMETMTALAHVQRAAERNIFYVDVGDMAEEDALNYVQKIRMWIRKKEFFDPQTNQFLPGFNPVTLMEDLFWPTRPGTENKVDTLQGRNPPQGLIDDLNYYRNKMCAGLGIPRDFLDGTNSGAFDSKAALMVQDIHFAKKIERLQRSYRKMVKRTLVVAYVVEHQTYPAPFEIEMGSTSLIADRLYEDVMERRATLVNTLSEVPERLSLNKSVWSKYVFTTVFKDIPSDIQRQLFENTEDSGPSSFSHEEEPDSKAKAKTDDTDELSSLLEPYINQTGDSATIPDKVNAAKFPNNFAEALNRLPKAKTRIEADPTDTTNKD